jgi:HD-like signal output (HDOD) protein
MIRTTNPRNLRQLLAHAELPALPQSAVQLIQLARNPKIGPPEVAVVVESDPGLTAQVLQFINSSYFGFATPISSVQQAIALVGVKAVSNFVLWRAIFRSMPNPMRALFNLQGFRQDALTRALFARAVGRKCGLSEVDGLFTAALLQDMAIPFLVSELPFEYHRLIQAREDGKQRLSDLEKRRFGWTHADAASLLSRAWGLPDELTKLIGIHTRLEEILAARKPSAACVAVSLSALLPASTDDTWRDERQLVAVYQRLFGNQSDIDELAKQIDEDYCELALVLRLGRTGPRLSSRLAQPGALAKRTS